MAFVKLDAGILESTLWLARDVRDVFITALLMAQPHEISEPTAQLQVRALDQTGFIVPPGWYGLVKAAGVGICRRAMVDRDAGLDALENLGSPDPESRTPDHDGRRLVRVDGGFLVLNFIAYRERDASAATRARRYRERKKIEKPEKGVPEVTKSVTEASRVTTVTRDERNVTRDERNVTRDSSLSRSRSRSRSRSIKEKTKEAATADADAASGESGKTGKREKVAAMPLAAWLEIDGNCPSIDDADPIYQWAETVGVPRDWVAFAWEAFAAKFYADPAKKQVDWRAHFRNAVRGDWLKIWRIEQTGAVLTTAGRQWQRVAEAEAET